MDDFTSDKENESYKQNEEMSIKKRKKSLACTLLVRAMMNSD